MAFFKDGASAEVLMSWPAKKGVLPIGSTEMPREDATSAEIVIQARTALAARKALFRDYGAALTRDEVGIGHLTLNGDRVSLDTPAGAVVFVPVDPFTAQYVSEIKMPRPYWDTLTTEKMFDLLSHDANKLGEHFGKKKGDRDRMLLRAMIHVERDGAETLRARALLSDRFAFLDHDFAFEVVSDHLSTASLNHWDLTVTPFSFYLDAMGPFMSDEALLSLEPEVREGVQALGNIHIGWTLTNSEVGQGSMKIQPRVQIGDQILTMEAEKEKWIHRGSKLVFSPQTCRAIVEADEKLDEMRRKVVAACERVVSPEGFRPILSLIAAAEETQPKDASLGFTRVSRVNEIANRLTKEDRETILRVVADRSASENLTVLDVARIAADHATQLPDRDHQAEVSEVAGLLVRLAGSALWGAAKQEA